MSNDSIGYNSSTIQVLKGLEGVRKRPAMYIGNTDKQGLHHLVWEILDNSVDEAMAGFAKNINVTIHADEETISIEDDGRGIPVDIHPIEGKSALEVAMTVLHAGGKMTSESSGYVASGGLHGVGASCVNALSDKMTVEVHRDGYLWSQEYSIGKPIYDVKKVRKLEKKEKETGTKSTWHADISIFKHGVKLDETDILRRLRETAFLNKGINIVFVNEAKPSSNQTFKFDGGIGDYVLYMIQNKNGIYPEIPIYGQKTVDGTQVEISIAWTDDDDSLLLSYANNINTIDGGTHLSGFKTSITRTINKFAFANGVLKEKDDGLEGRDIQEGLTAIISIRLPQPEFIGQTKAKLATVEAESIVSNVTADVLTDYFEHNPKVLARVVDRAYLAQRARKAAKDASAALKKKSFLGNSGRIPGKLRDCRSSDNTVTELFIVEGDSAAGSASGGRDSEVQAILSNKGKIINAEKSDLSDMLKNEEVLNLMICIGTGVKDQFDITKLKYGKIIIMSDADDDGFHIRTLLMTFFYRFMRPLIEHGHVFVAQAPLYMIDKKGDPIYCWSDHELQENMAKLSNKPDVKRFKGLGEMDAEQLADTTMRKGKRHLLQVSMDDAAESERMLTVLMGKNVQVRKEHIINSINNKLITVGD